MADEFFKQQVRRIAHSGANTPDLVPTKVIKKGRIDTGTGDQTQQGSVTPVSGKNGILTRLHFASNLEESQFALVDRNGTFDAYRVGTATKAEGTNKTIQGNWVQPIAVVEGTFSIYSGQGSVGSGSVTWSFELVQL